MFRSRRTVLVKRLWKCRRAGGGHEAAPGSSAAPCPSSTTPDHVLTKSVTQSMLKRLKERQLEVLVQAVESRGGETTGCVMVPGESVRLGRRTVAPHVLCCQVWRWPDLASLTHDQYTLKRLPCCSAADEAPAAVCCNPYHWSLLYVPETPPPPYTTEVLERVIKQGTQVEEEVASTETGGTPTPLRLTPSGGSGSQSSRGPFWCNIAYWEHRQRVGRLYTVFEPTVNVFQQLPHGDGLCLSVLQEETKSESVQRTRDKIGFGVTLSKEDDGIWVYNRSDYPIFVNSPTLDIPNARTFSVWKVQPGFSLKMFDLEQSEILKLTRDPELLDGPYDPSAVRISFAKGWGTCYSRQFITSCPCWIEVLLSVNR